MKSLSRLICALFISCNAVCTISTTINANKYYVYKKVGECTVKVLQQLRSNIKPPVAVTLINIDRYVGGELLVTKGFSFRSETTFSKYIYNAFNGIYLIKTENFTNFKKKLTSARKSPYWNPRANFIVLAINLPSIEDMSILLHSRNIFNVTVIAKSKLDKEFAIFGFKPMLDTCNKPEEKRLNLISKCSNYNGQNTFLYTIKDRLKNCNFKMVAHYDYPFMNLKPRGGIEYELLKIWRQIDNVTAELVDYGKTVEPSKRYGTILKNGTFTGMLGWIGAGKVEGAIGGYCMSLSRSVGLDYSYPHFIDNFRAAVRCAKPMGFWQLVFARGSIFLLTSLLLYLTFCVTVIFLPIFGNNTNKMRNFILVFGYFVNNVTKKVYLPTPAYKIYFISLLIYSFIISYIFQANLSSAKTHPLFEPEVDSYEDLLKQYKGITPFSNWPEFFTFDGIGLLDSCNSHEDCLSIILNYRDRPTYALVTNIHFDWYIWKITGKTKPEIRLIKDRLGSLLRTTYFSRGSPITHAFSEHLGRLVQSGILDKIIEDIDFDVQLKSAYSAESQPSFVASKIGDFKEPILILFIGYITSFIIFLLELIIKRFEKYEK